MLLPGDAVNRFLGSWRIERDYHLIFQMLLQYEHAGQEAGQKDTDSTYYRRLKAAALQAHVDRRRAKLNRG